ncbi:DUF6578 domain-containing protein [Streptomyces sp. NPDC002851]
MELLRVEYESWQLECCGKPFAVGDEVTWPITRDPERPDRTPWVENHADRVPTVTGTVRGIELVREDGGRRAVGSCPKWFDRDDRRAVVELDVSSSGS